MKIKYIILLFLFISFRVGVLYAQSSNSSLKKFLESETLRHSAISFELKELSSGNVVASYNKEMSLTPASVNKIITTAVALLQWGEKHHLKTSIYYDGIIQDSILVGNLYVKGCGDPTLGSEFIKKDKNTFFKESLNAIKKQGIKGIAGDLIVLDQLFGYEGVVCKWLWEDLGNYYASPVVGISLFDNLYRIYLRSSNPGDTTEIIKAIPSVDDLIFKNEVIAGKANIDQSFISGTPFSKERRLYGSIPPNRSSFVIKGDIPDPGLFMADYFKSYLINHGINLGGKSTTYRLYPVEPLKKVLIHEFLSPNISSIVRVINEKSNNHYAEHLYKLLTIREGLDISRFWKVKGLDSSALFLVDGSGLSPLNAVSASFINAILEYMYKKEGVTGAFYKSLPIAGREGTVVSFLKGTTLEGKARVKSGSITNVCSYAGYIEYENKIYAFSILINNFKGSRAQLRKEIGNLLSGLL